MEAFLSLIRREENLRISFHSPTFNCTKSILRRLDRKANTKYSQVAIIHIDFSHFTFYVEKQETQESFCFNFILCKKICEKDTHRKCATGKSIWFLFCLFVNWLIICEIQYKRRFTFYDIFAQAFRFGVEFLSYIEIQLKNRKFSWRIENSKLYIHSVVFSNTQHLVEIKFEFLIAKSIKNATRVFYVVIL